MPAVTLVGYGLGNIQAFCNMYRRMEIEVAVAESPAQVRNAERLIFPGVGSFDWAMTRLSDSGLLDSLTSAVVDRGCPILGVCVGLQMMAKGSSEGTLPGLGWLDGTVDRLTWGDPASSLPLPHMGWNDVLPEQGNPLFAGLDAPRFYFLHSYRFVPNKPSLSAATCDYGGTFCCAASLGNIYGVQFHPEKSHRWGVKLLRNFAELPR